MELLVNQEGKLYGWMSKTSIVYTLRRIGNTIEFWPTRDYNERNTWGQKVSTSAPKSGDYITVSGVTYLMVFPRFSKGSDVTISPVPEDWETPPTTNGLKWRTASSGAKILVDHLGKVLLFDNRGEKLVVGEDVMSYIWNNASAFSNYVQQWGSTDVAITGTEFNVSDDGVEYTFTSSMIVAGADVTITPEPTNY